MTVFIKERQFALHIKHLIVCCLLNFMVVGDILAQEDRQNVALFSFGTEAYISQSGEEKPARHLIDGNWQDESNVSAQGKFDVILNFPQRVKVTSIRVFSGNTSLGAMPSGACGLKAYIVYGWVNGGWVELAKESNAQRNIDISSSEIFTQHSIKPIEIEKLKLQVLESFDTGLRLANPDRPVEGALRVAYIREIQVFSDQTAKPSNMMRDLVKAEYVLPLYRNTHDATLEILVDKKLDKESYLLTIRPFDQKDMILEKRDIVLSPGTNQIQLKINHLAAGRYLTEIESKKLSGKQQCLLRIERLQQPSLDTVQDMTNLKMFFPDSWHLSDNKHLRVTTASGKLHEIATSEHLEDSIQKVLHEGTFLRGLNLNPSTSGKYVAGLYHSTFSGSLGKKYWAVADSLEGPWHVTDSEPEGGYLPRVAFKGFEHAKPNWHNVIVDKRTKMRFYDAQKDGNVPVSEIKVVWSGLGEADWGCVRPPLRSTWPVWRNKEGEFVLMSREPFMTDRIQFDEDEFENPGDSNDNFCGQWLSPDGKELFYCYGATLRRQAPFIVPYDNLPQLSRVLVIYSTTDGINWGIKSYMPLPTESEGKWYQHYGGTPLVIGEGSLYIMYLLVYEVSKQQLFLELSYSRDGYTWNRFDHQKPFLANGEFGSWSFGNVGIGGIHLENKGKYYGFVSRGASWPHFYLLRQFPDIAKSTNAIKRTYKERGLEEWPYFDAVGGWDGIGKDAFERKSGVGVASFRKNGWFGIGNEDNRVGEFVTKPIKVRGKITVNAEIKGKITLELLDVSGKPLPGYSGREAAVLQGNGTDISVRFGAGIEVPTVDFRIKCRLDNSVLYTINFE